MWRAFRDTAAEFLAQTAKHRTAVHKALYTDDAEPLKRLRTFCRRALKYLEENPRKRVTLEETVAAIVAKRDAQRHPASEVGSESA
jgi:hypothetical protein